MKMNARRLSLVLTALIALTAVLPGCAAKKETATSNNQKEITDLVWVTDMVQDNCCVVNNERIVSELNSQLLRKGYKLNVKFKNAGCGDYKSKDYIEYLTKLKSSGEQADIIKSPYEDENEDSGFLNLSKSELIENLDSYFNTTDGKWLKSQLCSKSINNFKIGGRSYAIGTNHPLGVTSGFTYNKDLLKKYNIDKKDLNKPFWELDDILDKVYKGEGDSAAFTTLDIDAESLRDLNYHDMITECVGVAMRDRDAQAVYGYDCEYVKNFLKAITKYRDAGYMNNCATGSDFSHYTSWFTDNDLLNLKSEKVEDGEYEKTYIASLSTCASNSSEWCSSNGIASWSKNKDAAFKMLGIVNTDKQIANLLEYGIEGKDYNLNDGVVKPINRRNLILGGSCLVNNALLLPDNEYINKNFDINEQNERVQSSPILGFYFDKTPVAKEVAATDTITKKWAGRLFYSCDVDAVLAQMKLELKNAGLDKVIAEANKQIKAYKGQKTA